MPPIGGAACHGHVTIEVWRAHHHLRTLSLPLPSAGRRILASAALSRGTYAAVAQLVEPREATALRVAGSIPASGVSGLILRFYGSRPSPKNRVQAVVPARARTDTGPPASPAGQKMGPPTAAELTPGYHVCAAAVGQQRRRCSRSCMIFLKSFTICCMIAASPPQTPTPSAAKT